MSPLLLGGASLLLLCLGALVGSSWTAEAMGRVSRRHAQERRSLNEGWRALDAVRRNGGEPRYCDRCHQTLSESSWLLVVPALTEEEDDGT